jgi:tRNA nucleotidyltransferase/poly(A) polymerase
MKSIINKLIKKKSVDQKKYSFVKIQKEFETEKIFKTVSEYSSSSEIRYVGGCVRRIINGEEVDDIDLATNIDPKKLINCLKKNRINYYKTGIDHGTVTAVINDKKFEITSLRKDISTDGRHAIVKFSENWFEDAQRRDFTINCIYSDFNGNLFDPFNGKRDLENGKVIFIGNAEKRIKEDYLRILRYVRFFLNYSKIQHSSEIKKIIKQNIDGVKNLSKERLIDELKKLILSKGFLK